MAIDFDGIAPITINLNNNDFKIGLEETDIGQDVQFDTANVAVFTNNIKTLSLDKFGRVTALTTGIDLPAPNQIQISDLLNNDTLLFTGHNGHMLTEIVDNRVVTKLDKTSVLDENTIIYEIKNNNAVADGLKIRLINTTTYVDNIQLFKGKKYIFRQYDDTSGGTALISHAIGFTTTINEASPSPYTDGIEYFIKDESDNLLGPLTYNEYSDNFVSRIDDREPYIQIKLLNNAPSVIYIYSQFSPSNVANITLNIYPEIEFVTYNDVKSIIVDTYGRLHTVEQIPNSDEIMSQFNTLANDSNQITTKHNNVLGILGQAGHITSYVNNNNIVSRLEETRVMSTDLDNVNIIIEQIVDVLSGAIKWYLPSSPETSFTTLDLLKGRTYRFNQIFPLAHTHSMGISTSLVSTIEYVMGVEYHVFINNVDTIVPPNEYNDYFINARLNGFFAYILFNVPNDAPSKLYMYSRFSGIMSKMELNVISDFKRIHNLLSITVDRFGRIHDAISAVDNNRVEFIIELVGYDTLLFGLNQRSIYIQTLVAYFTIIDFSDISLSVIDVDGVVRVTTSVNELSTLKSNSIQTNINNLHYVANTALNFQNSLISGGLSLLTGFNIIQTAINIVVANNTTITSFQVNVNGNDINVTDLSTLKLQNSTPIVLTEDINNKCIDISLDTVAESIVNHTGGISKMTVDTFGRVTNVTTGTTLPISGVTAGTYGPSISEVIVDQFGIVTSITSSDLPTDISNEITRATSKENTLTTNLHNEIIRASDAESVNSVSISTEITRAIGVEGILTNLNTINKTSLVNAINSERTRTIIDNAKNVDAIVTETNRAMAQEAENSAAIVAETNRSTIAETTINNTLDMIGSLTNYSAGNTLVSNIGDLNILVGNKTNLIDYINSIGNIDMYNSSSTFMSAIGNLSAIPNGSSISEFILKYGEANLLTSPAGRSTLLEIIGNDLMVSKYSYGPLSLSFGGSFNRDGYYPLFTSINNLNTWKNANIIHVLNDALTRTTNPSEDYTNIQTFRDQFVYNVTIGPGQTIDHDWNIIMSFEIQNQVYYTITHSSNTSNPTISFTNTSGIIETISIQLNSFGGYGSSIISDIASLEGQISIINTSIGISSVGSGSGADILGKLSALGNTPNLKNIMNDRSLVNLVGILSSDVATTWNNNTILETIGVPTKLPGTDITSELHNLGLLSDYTSNTLISKIGNISEITSTIKDIVDALGNITGTYNSGNTLLSNLYTSSQADVQIANLIDSSPESLNTLNKLATALGNDADFSTTMTNQISSINASISNVENTSLSLWPGTSNVMTLGTVTTGTWQGTDIEITKVGWTNKANASILQTDLPASSNNSLIARVVDVDSLYFSNGNAYKRVSNYDDVTSLLSGKQALINDGPLTTVLSGPDFTINRVLLSDSNGKVSASSSITKTMLDFLNGVTGDSIQTQLNRKQSNISTGDLQLTAINGVTMSLDELNFITGVNNPIQTQIDNKEPIISLTANRFMLTNDSGNVSVSSHSVSDLEFSYLEGVTSPIQTQINNINTNSINSVSPNDTMYFRGFLDYHVSLNSDGTFVISGQQCINKPIVVKFSLQLNGDETRTIYDDISRAQSPSKYIKDEGGVTWFKPPYESKPSLDEFDNPSLLLTNLDTSAYDDFGFTIVYYLKNFKYLQTPEYFSGNIMSFFSDDVTNSEIIKSRILFFDHQFEYKIVSSKYQYLVETEASPSGPRYQWDDSADFIYKDTNGILKNNPDDVWFVAFTFKSGVLAGNTFGENAPNNKKKMQFFYKRSGFNKFNCSKVWEPTWANNQPDETWTSDGLNKHFKENSWLVFGSSKQTSDEYYPSGGLTTSNWESFDINKNGKDMMADVDISEIMIFNKAFSIEELSRLSKLSPLEAKTLFS